MPRAAGKSAAISPEKLLELMLDPEEPNSVVQILKKVGLSPGTVTIWKQKIPGFKKAYTKALRGIRSKSVEQEKGLARKTGWEDDFIEFYSKNGKYYDACDRAGVHHKTVSSRLEEDNKLFDPVFSEQFKEADAGVSRALVDVAHKRAIEDESDGMIKFLLATRLPDTYGQKITKTNIVKAEIEFTVVEERARKFLSEVLDVVDAEFIESSEGQGLLPEAVREDERSISSGHNWNQALAVQERSFLPAQV